MTDARESSSLMERPKRKMSGMGAALLAGTWPPEMEMIEPTVNLLALFDTAPSLAVAITATERHLWPCYRFSSCMGDGGYWVPWEGPMDNAYHFVELQMASEADIDQWVQTAMFQTLRRDRPPWRITVLHAKQGRSAIWFQVHHSVGDGLGLVFAFIPMLRCEEHGVRVDPFSKIPLPAALLPKSARKPGGGGGVTPGGQPAREASSSGEAGGGCLARIKYFFKGMLISLLCKHDAELCINAPLGERTPFLRFNARRVYTRFPPVPMETVRAVRNKVTCTVNDVVMAALTGALRRYGAEVGNDPSLRDDGPEDIEFKSLFMIGLPRPLNEDNLADSLANNILFASCGLPIGDKTASGRLEKTIQTFSNLKSKSYMAGLAGFTAFVKGVAPTNLMRKAASETFSKHTLLVTNVPSTTCPMIMPDAPGGQMVKEMQMVFPNLITQVSLISYNGAVYSNIIADPALIAQPHVLGKFFLEEFHTLANPV